MGNRCYLSGTYENGNSILIMDANNIVPPFWLSMIDTPQFDVSDPQAPAFAHADTSVIEAVTGAGDGPVSITLSKSDALRCLENKRALWQAALPEGLRSAYDEWIAFLTRFAVDAFTVDFTEFCWFYESVDEAKQDLVGYVHALNRASLVPVDSAQPALSPAARALLAPLLRQCEFTGEDDRETLWCLLGDTPIYDMPWEHAPRTDSDSPDSADSPGFLAARREPLLREAQAQAFAQRLDEDLARHRQHAKDSDLPARAQRRLAERIAVAALSRWVLDFSRGAELEQLGAALPAVIDTFDRGAQLSSDDEDVTGALDLDVRGHYVQVLWLVSLSTLLGQTAQLRRIETWLDRLQVPRDRDVLLERLLAWGLDGQTQVGRTLLHVDTFRPLAKGMEGDEPGPTALIGDYLAQWPTRFSSLEWHDAHLHRDADGFFGYWSFETAAVVAMAGLDDTPWRTLAFYPTALADHWRRARA